MRMIFPLSSVVCLLSLLLLSSFVQAEEWGFSFSGQILESKDGVKIPARYKGATNYTANVYIRLYDERGSETPGKDRALWGRCISVSTSNGVFTCELRDSAGVDTGNTAYSKLQDAFAHATGDSITVGVTPFDDSEPEITPRQSLQSIPYSYNAGDATCTVGDITTDRMLTIGAARIPEAVFSGTVAHDGPVVFASETTVPALPLNDTAPFDVATLAVSRDVSLPSVQTREVKTAELTANVRKIGTAVFTNLTLNGSVATADLTDDGGGLTVEGSVATGKLKSRDLVLGGSFDFFKWGEMLELTGSTETSKTHYVGDEKEGRWTVPDDLGADVFISITFRLPAAGKTEITIAGTTVATLATENVAVGDGGYVALPFQAFLLRGQEIKWSGGATGISVYYRMFTY